MTTKDLIKQARAAYAASGWKDDAEVSQLAILCVRLADSLESLDQKHTRLLVAGEPQRRANRRRNAEQADALRADGWDQAVAAMRYSDGSRVEVLANSNPYRTL